MQTLILTILLSQASPFCQDLCEPWSVTLGEAIEAAAQEYQVPPDLILALTLHETYGTLDPRLVGKAGEVGVFQLLPKAYWGKLARGLCKRDPEDCTATQAYAAAALLRMNKRSCGGWYRGLVMYNSGHCHSADGEDYARRVLRRRRGL